MKTAFRRRKMLAVTGGLALNSIGSTTITGKAVAAPSTDSFSILAGTEHETTGYVRTAETDGPTVMVIGGIHGNEVAGYKAAAKVTDMAIERGQLVTIPRANVAAIKNGNRNAKSSGDLNRQFPVGKKPRTELAQMLWDVVTRYDPDVFIDLHESKGVFDGDIAGGVGQATFYSRDDAAHADAREAAKYLNENYVTDSAYNFTIDPLDPVEDGLAGLFVHKVVQDTDAVSFLVETTYDGPTLATRIQWHRQIVGSLTDEELFVDGS